MRKVFFTPIAFGLVLAFWAQPALAVDGVIELNQSCVADGCIADDNPDFPIEIKHRGSYRLTGNLLLPNANTTAIMVYASHVSIDLNGFSIEGVTECTGQPATCTNTGTGRGITVDTTALPIGLSVSNGHIVGMGQMGIVTYRSAIIRDLHVTKCGLIGIFVTAQSLLNRVSVTFNGQDGIQASLNITITDSQAAYNEGVGITIGENTVGSDSSAYGNGNSGIVGGAGSAFHNNAAVSNVGAGFSGGAGTVFRGNTSVSNTFGIAASDGSLLESNIARANTEYGFQLSTDTVYRGNSLTGNLNAPLSPVSPGVNGGDNYCAGPSTVLSSCP